MMEKREYEQYFGSDLSEPSSLWDLIDNRNGMSRMKIMTNEDAAE